MYHLHTLSYICYFGVAITSIAFHRSSSIMSWHSRISFFLSSPFISFSIYHNCICKIHSGIMNTLTSMNYIVFCAFFFYSVAPIMSRNKRRPTSSIGSKARISSIITTTTQGSFIIINRIKNITSLCGSSANNIIIG